MTDRVLTCVYCGQEYPRGTPRSQHKMLYEHIARCPKHPLAKAVQFIQDLRFVLWNKATLDRDTLVRAQTLDFDIRCFLEELGVDDGSH